MMAYILKMNEGEIYMKEENKKRKIKSKKINNIFSDKKPKESKILILYI